MVRLCIVLHLHASMQSTICTVIGSIKNKDGTEQQTLIEHELCI